MMLDDFKPSIAAPPISDGMSKLITHNIETASTIPQWFCVYALRKYNATLPLTPSSLNATVGMSVMQRKITVSKI